MNSIGFSVIFCGRYTYVNIDLLKDILENCRMCHYLVFLKFPYNFVFFIPMAYSTIESNKLNYYNYEFEGYIYSNVRNTNMQDAYYIEG